MIMIVKENISFVHIVQTKRLRKELRKIFMNREEKQHNYENLHNNNI